MLFPVLCTFLTITPFLSNCRYEESLSNYGCVTVAVHSALHFTPWQTCLHFTPWQTCLHFTPWQTCLHFIPWQTCLHFTPWQTCLHFTPWQTCLHFTPWQTCSFQSHLSSLRSIQPRCNYGANNIDISTSFCSQVLIYTAE